MMEYFSGGYYIVKSGDKNYMFYNHAMSSVERGDAFYRSFHMMYRDSEGKLQERIFEVSVKLHDGKVISFSCDTFHYLMTKMMADPTKFTSVIQNLIFKKSKTVSLDGFNPAELMRTGYEPDDDALWIATPDQDGVIVTFSSITPATK